MNDRFKYRRDEMWIHMASSQTGWGWVLEDTQGEQIERGSRGDFEDAARDALKAYDRNLAP